MSTLNEAAEALAGVELLPQRVTAASATIEIGLPATAERQRHLIVRHEGRYATWIVSLYAPRATSWSNRQLVHASLFRGEPPPRLVHDRGAWLLWFGLAAFDLSESEARRVRQAFESRGLRVEQRP